MASKATNSQPAARRTPLSLSTASKPANKPTNDNTKLNSNNQKTENTKKDSQSERKLSSDKKQSATETRKPSVDSKKPEEVKIAPKSEDTKKNQNGVNSTNGVKDKANTNGGGGTNKPKSETVSSSSSTNAAAKRESQKPTEKKTANEVSGKPSSKDTKIEDNKKEKPMDDITKKEDGKNKDIKVELKDAPIEKKKDEETKKIDRKSPTKEEQKSIPVETSQNVKEAGKSEKEPMNITDVESLPEQIIPESPVKEKKQTAIELSTPKKMAPPKQAEKQVEPTSEFDLTDVEMMEMMEPLIFVEKQSPKISAASTPSKPFNRSGGELPKSSPKSETKPPKPALIPSPDRKSCPRTFSSISGRRTIRPIGDYTFSGNLNIRESYRKINTELDFTTSSLNVTVGSEVPNNDSFSFFSRSRKRDRSSPSNQSAMEIQADISPKSPKRPRMESSMSGFFTAMASPITMLRSRLSRATVQSTPKKLIEVSPEDDIVENVSGISVEEEITATEDLTVNPDSTVEIGIPGDDDPKEELASACSAKQLADSKSDDDIKTKETITSSAMQAKKKCSIM